MPPSILCIDDREQMLAVRQANLTSVGYSVVVATSAAVGMKLLKEMPVDAVLLEYKKEGIDAEAVAFHIKGRFPNVPIILLSAYSEMSERVLWLVDEYVMKSAPLEELVGIIERTVQLPVKRTVPGDTGVRSNTAA